MFQNLLLKRQFVPCTAVRVGRKNQSLRAHLSNLGPNKSCFFRSAIVVFNLYMYQQ